MHLYLQAFPYRKEALIVSPWPQNSLPRNVESIKRFENLQALVSTNFHLYIFCKPPTEPCSKDLIFISSEHVDTLPVKSQTRAIRNARAEYSVEPVKRISASVVGSAEVIEYISVSNSLLILRITFMNLPCVSLIKTVFLCRCRKRRRY